MENKINFNSKYNKEIIEKCINLSFQTEEKRKKTSIKNKIINAKNSLKYNTFMIRYKFVWPKNGADVFLFHKKYINEAKFNEKLKKILLITYRSYYKKQISIKNKSSYISDCGWGCMIRSSQMIFARMIYKIFRYRFQKRMNADILIKSIIPFFLDNNINLEEIPYNISDCFNIMIQNYVDQINLFLKEKTKDTNNNSNLKIQSIDPPFSIHKICMIGEIFGRTCGEWFSDYEIPKIYEIINSIFNILPELSIIHFRSEIDMKLIIEKCFEKEENNIIDDEIPEEEINYFINEKKEKYVFKKIGGIFISVRLGVKEVPSEYYNSIKNLFKCKQFLGFIGGKNNSAAYYFGYSDDNILYLDPHFNQESISNLDEKNLMTYINKTVYHLPFSSIQSGFTIGFLIRNITDFEELKIFFRDYIKDKFPCFHVIFENEKNKEILTPEEINKNINNNEDDF